jgi:hypothetical protein
MAYSPLHEPQLYYQETIMAQNGTPQLRILAAYGTASRIGREEAKLTSQARP